jgi:hypothetical protein
MHRKTSAHRTEAAAEFIASLRRIAWGACEARTGTAGEAGAVNNVIERIRAVNLLLPFQRTRRGYLESAPAERATFGMVSGLWLSIGISRGINYVRERRRAAPRLRGLGRSIYHAPGQEQIRIHHFVPGIGIAFVTGAVAILLRSDGREAWLGAPFGAGVGLTIDELSLLIKLDNPYWGSQTTSLIEGGVAALASVALSLRFHHRGRADAPQPDTRPVGP